MKKIRRMRIRTESSRIVFIKSQTGRTDEDAPGSADTCPACGQRLIASTLASSAALLPACPEIHAESGSKNILESKKQEK